MHRIDEASPLHDLTPGDIAGVIVRINAVVEALDLVPATVIHTIPDRGPEQVLFGMRQADAVSTDTQPRIIADLRLLSDVEATDCGDEPCLAFEDAAESPEESA